MRRTTSALLWLAVLLAVLVVSLVPSVPVTRVSPEERVDAVAALLRQRRVESHQAAARGDVVAASKVMTAVGGAIAEESAQLPALAASNHIQHRRTASPHTTDADI